MRIMFLAIFLLYGGIQLYDVSRIVAGLALPWPGIIALVAWAVLMTMMPLLIWRWERHGWHRPVLVGAWVGYGWMGVSFLFFWISLAVSLVGVLLPLASADSAFSARTGFLWACALTAVVTVYGFIDARRLRIERVTIQTPKLPTGSRTLRVALISDVHLGALIGARRLRAILDTLRALDPDVLVSAGDLVDGQADHLNGLAPMFAEYKPRLGKFAVTGNHEYFVGLQRALDFHERAGFAVLRGTVAEIAGAVRIAGVDDPTGQRMRLPVFTNERALLSDSAPGRFTILVKHQPRLDPQSMGKFDLQLSGHVHKGQIFPFGLLVRLSYPVATGLSALAGGGWLYVSRGTGTWGPPLRVAAAPEITLIEIAPATASQGEGASAKAHIASEISFETDSPPGLEWARPVKSVAGPGRLPKRRTETMTEQLSGGCDCGSVRYRLNGPVKMAVNCHCNTCRKRNGAAYSTYCVVAQDDLEILQGRESIATYDVDGRGQKYFCSKCGSPLYNANHRYPGVYLLFYGSLAPTTTAPAINVYCESKLPWVDNIAGIKSFEQATVR